MSIIPSEQLTFVSLCCLHSGDRKTVLQGISCHSGTSAVRAAELCFELCETPRLSVSSELEIEHIFPSEKGFFPLFSFFAQQEKKKPTKQQNKVSLLKLNHNSAFSVVFQVGDNSWSYSHPVALLRY